VKVLVLGLGNMLMGDDAFGGKVVSRLQERYHFSEHVLLMDGGTLGLDLLPFLEDADRLVIIDALQMQAEPGRIFRLEGEEVPCAFASKLSVHQMGVQDLLAVAELQGNLPQEVVVWGVQAGTIEPALEMSPEVTRALEPVVEAVATELAGWGVAPVAA